MGLGRKEILLKQKRESMDRQSINYLSLTEMLSKSTNTHAREGMCGKW